jgi:FkbM family methyltransferase
MRRELLIDSSFLPANGLLSFDPATWVLKETHYGFRLWVSLEERAISRPILTDVYEIPESRLIARTVRPGDSTIDIGANVGYHALHMARLAGPGGAVHAFEPLPYLAEALTRSIAENGFSNIRLHRTALDDRNGTALLRHAPVTANFGGAHLTQASAVPAAHADELVATGRFDDLLPDVRPSFVKIDVEGAEPRVLRGAAAMLAAARPLVLCELHNPQLRVVSGANAGDLLAQMRAAGYRASALGPTGEAAAAIDDYASDQPLNVLFSPVA